MIDEISYFPEIHDVAEVDSEELTVDQIQHHTSPTDDVGAQIDEGAPVDVEIPVFHHTVIGKGDNLKFTPGDSNEQLMVWVK